NRKDIRLYDFRDDAHSYGKQSVIAPLNGVLSFEGNFIKEETPCDITLEIKKALEDGTEEDVWCQTFEAHETFSGQLPIITDIQTEQEDQFYFRIQSLCNVDWSTNSWQPAMYYTDIDTEDPPSDPTEIRVEPAVNIAKFDLTVRPSYPVTIQDTIFGGKIRPYNFVPNLPQFIEQEEPKRVNINFLVYKNYKLLDSRYAYVDYPVSPFFDPELSNNLLFIQLDTLIPGDIIHVEYNIDDIAVAGTFYNVPVEFDDLEGELSDFNVLPGMHSQPPQLRQGLGTMYRNWGRFISNGNFTAENGGFIDPESLMYDASEINTADEDYYDQENPEDPYDPSEAAFWIMTPNPPNARWIGPDDLTYLSADTISCSRFGEDDLSIIDQIITGSGTGLRAPIKESVTISNAFSDNTDVGIGSFGRSLSVGNTRNKIEVLDMNGDGYPDMLTRNKIQYTYPTGELEPITRDVNVQQHYTTNSALNGSLGGSRAVALAPNSGGGATPSTKDSNQAPPPKNQNDSEQAKNSANQSKVSASINFGGNLNSDAMERTLMDINGDGLPDMVYRGNEVRLNLGYSFSDPIYWNFDNALLNGESTGFMVGGGFGFSTKFNSISLGFSFNKTNNQSNKIFQDITGDGLVDIITKNPITQDLEVQFNRGSSFSSQSLPWVADQTLNEGVSIGESFNVAFTVCINLLFIRICINPQFSTSKGFSRQRTTFTDINGDGYADFLESDGSYDELKYRLSTIGRTNMLKTIDRPMGSKLTLNYERTGNTFEQPNSLWVMNSCEVTDGVDEDGGVNVQ
ncbi:MAG: hypothetical protein AAFO91_02415, partial [Bacteroidota bacterium]